MRNYKKTDSFFMRGKTRALYENSEKERCKLRCDSIYCRL